jgi:hypothetical protein
MQEKHSHCIELLNIESEGQDVQKNVTCNREITTKY